MKRFQYLREPLINSSFRRRACAGLDPVPESMCLAFLDPGMRRDDKKRINQSFLSVKQILVALGLLLSTTLSAPLYAVAFEQMDESLPFKYGNLTAVKRLVEEADFLKNAPKRTVVQALLFSIESGNLDLIKYLAKPRRLSGYFKPQGWLSICDVDSNCHPIHMAASHEFRISEPMIRYLTSQGFSLFEINHDGHMPLHIAAGKGHFKLVKYLCEMGVKANIKYTYNNKTPLDMALSSLNSLQHSPDREEDAKIRAGLKATIEYLQSGQCEQASTVKPAPAKVDRVIGACHLIQNPPIPKDTAVNVVSVFGAVEIYFRRFEQKKIIPIEKISGKVRLLQEPKHGVLEMGPLWVRFHPVPGYYGPDSATFLVDIDGLVIKVKSFINIIEGGPGGGKEGYDPYEDKANCPNGAYWTISNAADEE